MNPGQRDYAAYAALGKWVVFACQCQQDVVHAASKSFMVDCKPCLNTVAGLNRLMKLPRTTLLVSSQNPIPVAPAKSFQYPLHNRLFAIRQGQRPILSLVWAKRLPYLIHSPLFRIVWQFRGRLRLGSYRLNGAGSAHPFMKIVQSRRLFCRIYVMKVFNRQSDRFHLTRRHPLQ